MKFRENTYQDNITTSKKSKSVHKKNGLITEFANHSIIFQEYFKGSLNEVTLLSFLNYNSTTLRKNLFINFNERMNKIEAVLKFRNSYIFFAQNSKL